MAAFVAYGHAVLVEKGAGASSGIPDEEYRAVAEAFGMSWQSV